MLMCHPLIAGWNELVIHTRKDATSKVRTLHYILQPNITLLCHLAPFNLVTATEMGC